MRPDVDPLPPMAELAALPVHVVVRDFPESLAVLRAAGVDAAARGHTTIAELAADAGPILAALETAAAWRSAGPAPPGTGAPD